MWRECLGLAEILDLHLRVVLIVDDLERPRLDILFDRVVFESPSNKSPVGMFVRNARSSRKNLDFVASLDVEDGIPGIHRGLILRSLSDETLLLSEGDEGGGGEAALFIGNWKVVSIMGIKNSLRRGGNFSREDGGWRLTY